MDTSLVTHTFDFENSSIRVLGEPDKPWFVAKDICNILGLSKINF
jgi:prophage antirepressor-like protein